MKKVNKGMAALLFALVVGLGLGGCGRGDDVGLESGANPSQPSTVAVQTGTLATDSWGYTGAATSQVVAPTTMQVVLQGHTLLEDASHHVVSGDHLATKVSFSSDITNLSATARASAPANFLCYLDLSLGSAAAVIPALLISVDSGAVSGTTVNIASYDPATGTWGSAQTAVAGSSGKVTFSVSQLGIWGIFR